MKRESGRIDLRVTLTQPFHHGAGSSGNTAMLRTKPVIDPKTGTRYDIPYLSANSVRHKIREGAAWHAIRTAGIEDGSLSKRAVHLLMSGGSLSLSSSAIDLRGARELTRLMPGLALVGFSAGNHIEAGKLQVSDLDLVCRENAWRSPDDVIADPRSDLPFGTWVDDHMSTRRDQMSDPHVRALVPAVESEAVDEQKTLALAEKLEHGSVDKDPSSMQMIYEHQILTAGAGLFGEIGYRGLGEMEKAALACALSHWCLDGGDGTYTLRLGARSSHGWGTSMVNFSGVRLTAPDETPDAVDMVAPGSARSDSVATYEDHLRSSRDAIVSMIGRL